jgi:hypothetical protein
LLCWLDDACVVILIEGKKENDFEKANAWLEQVTGRKQLLFDV